MASNHTPQTVTAVPDIFGAIAELLVPVRNHNQVAPLSPPKVQTAHGRWCSCHLHGGREAQR
jgi:hypothetical protein